MLLTSSASPGNQHRGDVPTSQLPRVIATPSNFPHKNLSIRGINFARVMRPTGVALPSFLKARQVLAGLG